MGRKKLWEERLHLTLAKGAKEAISAALLGSEDVLDLVRISIDRELIRRGCNPMPPPANEPPVKTFRPARPD